MSKQPHSNNRRRRRIARKVSGQISIMPLYLITTLACFCVFTAVCMRINAADDDIKGHSTRQSANSAATEQTIATQPSDRSQEWQSDETHTDRDLIEELMRKKARLIQSHREKGVEIAMVAPGDLP